MASSDVLSQPVREPDVMNDPEFDSNTKGKEKSMDDVDTCRICRGESSKEEPLFYPCKCSGSIKFVHQSCLMEWLSHSQKKHCELCKTPFRFTKLYHPNMPNSVPLPIFLRQAAVHSWRTLLAWSRFHLVLFVWVAWLPWCMRIVWRALFWIGDGGWINWQKLQGQASSAAELNAAIPGGEGGGSASTQLELSSDALASAVVSQMAKALPKFLSSSSPASNLTDRDPVLTKLIKKLMFEVFAKTSSQRVSFLTTPPLNATGMPDVIGRSSWLSGFSFLRFLTPSATFNNLVIDTLEGQLITLLVVIAFILIFLIREWVVQQQPGANIGAGPNANPPVGPGGDVPDLERIERQHAELRLQPANDDQADAEDEAHAELPAFEDRKLTIEAREVPHQEESHHFEEGQIFEALPESSEPPTGESQSKLMLNSDAKNVKPHDQTAESAPRRSSVVSQSTSPQRPSMPQRNSVPRAADIRRMLEEQGGRSDHDQFLKLWSRTKSNPQEVLKIIEEEGRSEELAWIVTAMKKLDLTLGSDKSQGSDHLTAEISTQAQIDTSATNYGIDDSLGASKSADIQPTVPIGLMKPTWSFDPASNDERPGNDDLITSEMAQAYSEDGIEGLETGLSLSNMNQDHQSWPASMETGSGVGPTPDTQPSSIKKSITHESFATINDPSELRADSSSRPQAGNPFHPDYEDSNAEDENPAESLGMPLHALGPASDDEHLEGRVSEDPADQDDLLPHAHPPNEQNGLGANQNLGDAIMNWLWGDINAYATPPIGIVDDQGGDDERIVADLADEAPFVPVEDGNLVINNINDAEDPFAIPFQDPGVIEAAVQAGLNPVEGEANAVEVVEEVEDLEGIMELVGMQGPLAALIQNGMFCAILVSMTIFLGVWVPYIAGKVFLVFLANPVSLLFKLPLRWASITADFIIDLGVFSAGYAFYWVDTIVRFLCAPVGWLIPPIATISQNKILAETAKRYAETATERLAKTFVATGGGLSESDIPVFSIIAHESLKTIEHSLNGWFQAMGRSCIGLIRFFSTCGLEYGNLATNALRGVRSLSDSVTANIIQGTAWISSAFHINPLRVNFSVPQRTTSIDYSLAYWNTKDRIIAIIFGYLFFSLIGALYLKISASIRGRNGNGRVEGVLADILYQAGGVLKVVLIISIEMIVFPLYCGSLLDIALLPLFGNVTAMSRVEFLLASPNTSLFVHWFIGTCYMFHFALFVSMCRKIMRGGVLCKFNSRSLFFRSVRTDFNPEL